MRLGWYVLALMAAATSAAAKADVWDKFTESDQELMSWIEKAGGKIDFKAGKKCPSCMRGIFASKDFKSELVENKPPGQARSRELRTPFILLDEGSEVSCRPGPSRARQGPRFPWWRRRMVSLT